MRHDHLVRFEREFWYRYGRASTPTISFLAVASVHSSAVAAEAVRLGGRGDVGRFCWCWCGVHGCCGVLVASGRERELLVWLGGRLAVYSATLL